jgi:hypothetical protein
MPRLAVTLAGCSWILISSESQKCTYDGAAHSHPPGWPPPESFRAMRLAAMASTARTSATWTSAVPFGAPLDERQGGEDAFGVGEVLARRGVGWLGVHGPGSVRSRPRCGAFHTGRGRLGAGALQMWHVDGTPRSADRYSPRNRWPVAISPTEQTVVTCPASSDCPVIRRSLHAPDRVREDASHIIACRRARKAEAA